MFDDLPVLSKTITITAREIGVQLSSEDIGVQAAILSTFAREIIRSSESANYSWSKQCCLIAEKLSDIDCRLVETVLGDLVEHLRACFEEEAEAERRSR